MPWSSTWYEVAATPESASVASSVTSTGPGCQPEPAADRSAELVTGATVSICGVRVLAGSTLPALSTDQ